MSQISLSVVAPFYNEYEVLPEFCLALRKCLDELGVSYEVILVDDGSIDNWREALDDLPPWPQFIVICLLSNSGHQNALDAGLQSTSGNWVVTMDSDMQHPPSYIGDLYKKAMDGNVDVIYAVRENRAIDSIFKKLTAIAYYRSIKMITGVNIEMNAADFRIMSRQLVDALNAINEEKIFRLLIPSLNVRSDSLKFVAASRAAGESKYPFKKMLHLAMRSAFSFTVAPLRLATILGTVVGLFAVIALAFVGVSFLQGKTVSGWSSVMATVLLLGGMQLFLIGILGEYIGRVLSQTRGRPRYLVGEKYFMGDAKSRNSK